MQDDVCHCAQCEIIRREIDEPGLPIEVKPFEPMRDIEEFHTRFGLTYHGRPRLLKLELAAFREKFMEEELNEYLDAVSMADLELGREGGLKSLVDENLAKALDALVDLTYVVLGTAYLHGFDFREAWRRVHEANMKKVRAQSATDSARGSKFDVVKPQGWAAPNLMDLVSSNIHEHLQPPLPEGEG